VVAAETLVDAVTLGAVDEATAVEEDEFDEHAASRTVAHASAASDVAWVMGLSSVGFRR
jgi:hypothetical protein